MGDTGTTSDRRLYVHTCEDGDAISIAESGLAANGAWTGISIARMRGPSKEKTQDEINAYAAIFAAAPDMLAALESALPFVAHFLGGWSTHTHGQISTGELHDRMRAAIAKAKGS